MEYILSGFTIGFIAAALPGAVQTTVLQSAIIGKAKSSIKFAIGAAIMDGLYIILSYYGLVQILVGYHWLKLLIGIIGSIYIAYIGIVGLVDSVKNKDTQDIKNRTFLSGFLLVLLHVPTLLYFIGITATIFKEKADFLTVLSAGVALSVGALTCFGVVAALGKTINYFGSKWVIKIFNIIASVILIFFAIKIIIGLF